MSFGLQDNWLMSWCNMLQSDSNC